MDHLLERTARAIHELTMDGWRRVGLHPPAECPDAPKSPCPKCRTQFMPYDDLPSEIHALLRQRGEIIHHGYVAEHARLLREAQSHTRTATAEAARLAGELHGFTEFLHTHETDAATCVPCRALAALKQPARSDDPEVFSVSLDGAVGEPMMRIEIERLDGLTPMASESLEASIQELSLRAVGFMFEAFGDTPAFRAAAAKWGFRVRVVPFVEAPRAPET